MLFDIHSNKQNDRKRETDHIHAQIGDDHTGLRGCRLSGQSRVIAQGAEENVHDTHGQDRKADHRSSVDRHGKAVTAETVLRLKVVQNVRKQRDHDVLGRYNTNRLEDDARADGHKTMNVDKSDKTARQGQNKSQDNSPLFPEFAG